MTKRVKKFLLSAASMGSALGISFGIVFGLASTQSVQYLDYGSAVPYKYYGGGSDGKGILATHKESADIWSKPWWSEEPTHWQYQALKHASIEMILDGANHQVMDQSFNQSAFLGEASWVHPGDIESDPTWPIPDDYTSLEVESADWLNDSKAESDRPIADTPNGFIQTYNSAVGNQGYKTLVLPGSLHANPLQQFSRQQKDTFDKAGYIFLDYDVGTPSDAPGRFTEDGVEHVASVLFRAEQAAFLAAISTCQYLNENFDQYYSPNKPLAIGTFGGNPIISVVSYMGGFELGAYLYNQMVTHEYQKFNYYGDGQPYNNDPTDVKHYYKNHLVNFINLGKPASWFSYSFNIGDGRLLTQTLLAQGADAIMPVAGPQTIDAVQEIKSQGSKCIVVGVDTDQENSTTVNDHSNFIDRGFTVDSVFEHEGNNGIIKFSATKDISYMTEIISYLAAMGFESTLNHGDTEEPKIGSYGYLTVGDLENNGVGVSDAAGPFLMKFIKSLRPTATASDVQDIIIKYILATAALSELPQVIDPITGESENWVDLINNNLCFRTS